MAVILVLYLLYPLLHVLSKVSSKVPAILVLVVGVGYFVLSSDKPFPGNTAYSVENHWGGDGGEHCIFDWSVLCSKSEK